jgi:hypothetical protein
VIFILEWPKGEFVSLWLTAFYLTKSLQCNVATCSRMLFIFRVFNSVMCFKKILCRFQDSVVVSLASVWTALYNIRTLISQQHPSGIYVQTPINVQKIQTIQGCIRSNVSATRPKLVKIRHVKGFPSQKQIWEDSCNRPDNRSTLSQWYTW